MNDRTEVENRLYVFPNSALKEHGKKINYFSFLKDTKEKDCIAALEYIEKNYEEEKIRHIIESTPISETKKEFYLCMVRERKGQIIDKAFQCNVKEKRKKRFPFLGEDDCKIDKFYRILIAWGSPK